MIHKQYLVYWFFCLVITIYVIYQFAQPVPDIPSFGALFLKTVQYPVIGLMLIGIVMITGHTYMIVSGKYRLSDFNAKRKRR